MAILVTLHGIILAYEVNESSILPVNVVYNTLHYMDFWKGDLVNDYDVDLLLKDGGVHCAVTVLNVLL